ncbi:hypothetical protein Bca101_033685 [Brassica carinata]
MGCATSACAVGESKNKRSIIQESVVFVLQLRVPVQTDLQRQLKGVASKTTIDRLACLRNQIQLVAEDSGIQEMRPSCGSAISELRAALEEYLSLLTGLIKKKDDGMEGCVEFKWKPLGDGGRAELCFTNLWMEMLTVIHMMAALAMAEANSLMIPKDRSGSGHGVRVVSSGCKRDAVDLLLKASGYLELCTREILPRIAPDIKSKLPDDMQESVLQTLSIQALGQAYQCLSGCAIVSHGCAKKLLLFTFWKFLEAKAAAYYYHGLVTEKGSEPACHASAVCCFLAASEILGESKKACLSFCLSPPVTRVMQSLPELPNFQLSLIPEEFELPEMEAGSFARKPDPFAY